MADQAESLILSSLDSSDIEGLLPDSQECATATTNEFGPGVEVEAVTCFYEPGGFLKAARLNKVEAIEGLIRYARQGHKH